MEKTYIICGKQFEAKDRRAICCSQPCRDERSKQLKRIRLKENLWIKKPKAKICPECGKQFVTGQNGRKYCGDECRYKTNLRNINRRKEEQRKAEAEEKARLMEAQSEPPVTARRRRCRGLSELSAYSRTAREQGKTYGQLQAEEYARAHRIVRKW